MYSSAVATAYKHNVAKWSRLGYALPNHQPRNPAIGQIILSILVGSAGPPCSRIYPVISLSDRLEFDCVIWLLVVVAIIVVVSG